MNPSSLFLSFRARSFGRILVPVVLMAISGPAGAATLLLNGSFQGLDHWTARGTLFNTGETSVFSDSAGLSSSLFQTTAVPDGARAWTVSFDFFNGLARAVPEGFVPDTLFASLFLGRSPFGPTLTGGTFDQSVELFSLDSGGAFSVVPGGAFGPSPKGAGWTRFTATLTGAESTAFLTMAFEFYDLNGSPSDSVAAIDNAGITQIPEPAAACILALSAGLLLLRRERRAAPDNSLSSRS